MLTASRQAPVLFAARFETNQFRCALAGLPGQTLVVQASTNLTQWMALQTNTLGISSTISFADPASGGLGRRFYRAALVPPQSLAW